MNAPTRAAVWACLLAMASVPAHTQSQLPPEVSANLSKWTNVEASNIPSDFLESRAVDRLGSEEFGDTVVAGMAYLFAVQAAGDCYWDRPSFVSQFDGDFTLECPYTARNVTFAFRWHRDKGSR